LPCPGPGLRPVCLAASGRVPMCSLVVALVPSFFAPPFLVAWDPTPISLNPETRNNKEKGTWNHHPVHPSSSDPHRQMPWPVISSPSVTPFAEAARPAAEWNKWHTTSALTAAATILVALGVVGQPSPQLWALRCRTTFPTFPPSVVSPPPSRAAHRPAPASGHHPLPAPPPSLSSIFSHSVPNPKETKSQRTAETSEQLGERGQDPTQH
jgi:hypothetical protein